MSLPAGFLDDVRSRVLLSQIIGRHVTWDMRRSNMAKGDWWAPCPFHQEKSASFHVDDRKGFYYCFGCQAKGDLVSFVMNNNNIGFMEAVSELAREAGLSMPEPTAQNAQRQDERTQLSEVMEAAVAWTRLQLNTSAASEARAYLARRGLGPDTCERWHIGYAPDGRQALFTALCQKGFSPTLIEQSGLCAKADDGSLYDRFRGRILFPIRDARGRAISFGGRALAANARAKYLNGPQTALFDKGRSLFNIGPARTAAGKGNPIIVAEGYMDVIALSEAGFGGALAPLGTAITEDQLRLLWRISDEPIIALDADAAGIRAGLRLVDLALPLLEAGKGLRFALLPGGMDPDDLIRNHGAPAMQKALNEAQPMVRLLWQREVEGKTFDSPERRAALDKSLRAHIRRITDPALREHYALALKELRNALFFAGSGRAGGRAGMPRAAFFAGGGLSTQARAGRQNWRGGPPPAPFASTGTRTSLLASAQDTHGSSVQDSVREALILATCIYHPNLLARFEDALSQLEFKSPDHAALRDILLAAPFDAGASAQSFEQQLRRTAPDRIEALLANPFVRGTPTLQRHAPQDGAEACLAEALERLEAERAHHLEIGDAQADIENQADERVTWRLRKAAKLKQTVQNETPHASERNDVVIAPNGVKMDKDEVNDARQLLGAINYSRKTRKHPHDRNDS